MKYVIMLLFFCNFAYGEVVEFESNEYSFGKGVKYSQEVKGRVVEVGDPVYYENQVNKCDIQNNCKWKTEYILVGYRYIAEYHGLRMEGVVGRKVVVGDVVRIYVASVFWAGSD